MKEVKAYVRLRVMEAVYNALRAAGYLCMTLTRSEGTGEYTVPHEKVDQPPRHPFMHVEMVKMEIICTPEEVDDIVRIIHENGNTGYSGDGIIMVSDIEKLYSVKDGRSGVRVLKT